HRVWYEWNRQRLRRLHCRRQHRPRADRHDHDCRPDLHGHTARREGLMPCARLAGVVLSSLVLLGVSARPAQAQDSISEVLSFLVPNRSIPTEDFARDEQAAAATRDTIAGFLVMEFATLPVTASSGGFTYGGGP